MREFFKNVKTLCVCVCVCWTDVESFLTDLQGRSAITGTVLIKQANLLEKIRAISSDGQTPAATTNHNHSNGQVTPPSSHGRKGKV